VVANSKASARLVPKKLSRGGIITRPLASILAACAIILLALPYILLGLDQDSWYPRNNNSLRKTTATGEPIFPLVVQFIDPNGKVPKSSSIFHMPFRKTSRTVEPIISIEMIHQLEDEIFYNHRTADVFETYDCKAQHAWQLQTFPTCNPIHEIDMPSKSRRDPDQNQNQTITILNHGYWRDVWVMRKNSHDNEVVLKTMRFMHNVTARNFDRNRRDALVMERLSSSRWVLDVYSFCANTGLSEYADGGDISTAIWPEGSFRKGGKRVRVIGNMPKRDQLIIGVQAAIALAELHTFDHPDRPSVAHTDISPTQFVKVGDRYKLNDFNRARFLSWNETKQKVCSFSISNNPGKNRSPEEYSKGKPLTEKIDLYSLGNIFYMMLQKEWPFKEMDSKEARHMVKHGYRPSFYADVWNSTDPYDIVVKEAMLKCHEQKPQDRASARELANLMMKKLEQLDPGLLESWGESLDS